MSIVKKYLKQLLLFAIVAGLLDYILFVALYLVDIKAFDLAYKFDFWLPFIFILISIYYCKKADYGFITFGQAFVVGMFVASVLSIIPFVLTYIHIEFLDPAFYQESLISASENLLKNVDKLTDKEEVRMVKNQAEQAKYISTLVYSYDKVLKLLLPSFVYSLILSILFRKAHASKS